MSNRPLDKLDAKTLKLVSHRAEQYKDVGKHSKMTEEERQRLLNADRDTLTPNEKRLQTMLKKHGTIAEALKHRDKTKLILGGKYAGKAKGRKGLAAMPKEQARAIQSKGGKAAYPKMKEAIDAKTTKIVIE